MTADEGKLAAGEAAKIFEELGDYDKAVAAYRKMGAKPEALLALARIARYRKDWAAQEEALKGLEPGADLAMETAFRLIARKDYDGARALLEPAIEKHPASLRLSEMRFYAGVSCWFLKARDRANVHWCWVAENIPDDRLARRCYIAAAAEGMPYENPELGGYAMESQYGSIDVIKAFASSRGYPLPCRILRISASQSDSRMTPATASRAFCASARATRRSRSSPICATGGDCGSMSSKQTNSSSVMAVSRRRGLGTLSAGFRRDVRARLHAGTRAGSRNHTISSALAR
jgi:tetratricopeptide (TPR) repeat protein